MSSTFHPEDLDVSRGTTAYEAESARRCRECGAVGHVGVPGDGCPDCHTPQEDVHYSPGG